MTPMCWVPALALPHSRNSLQMASIRVFFVVWVLVRDALKFTSTVARKLVARLLRLPKAVFPRRVYAIAVNVSQSRAIGRSLAFIRRKPSGM